MGPQRALGIPAWYSGVRYLSETVAGLPIHRYRNGQDGRTRRADPLWMSRPDVETPWFSVVEFWMMSLLHRGNAYTFKIRNDAGRVTGLRGIHPDRVKPGQASDGTKVFQIDNRQDVVLTRREIFHIPGLSYNGVIGLNPLQHQAETLGGVAAANESAQRFFGQGSIKEAFISAPATLTETQANELRDVWEKQHQGLLNAHTVAVLGGGAEYKTIGLDPAASQLLETRKWGVIEVAQVLRMPPHKLYELTRATFSNIEHQSIEAVTDSIQPWAQRIEAHLNFDPDLTVSGTFEEFILEGLLRGDTASRFEAYSKATGRPWMTPAEVRQRENLPPLDGLDTVASPLNMAGDASSTATDPAPTGGPA